MKPVPLLAGLGLLLPLPAGAAPNQLIEEATVLWKDHYCAFFIVQTPGGYTLFEWMSGPRPNEGDTIEGPMEGFGPRNLVNKTASHQVTMAYTEVHSTSKAFVGKKIPGFCRRKKDFLARLERERSGQEPGVPAAPSAQQLPVPPQQNETPEQR